MIKPNFQTFGCKLNTYETELMEELCKNEGLENVVVINTCAVTAEAVRKAKRTIRKSHREMPYKKIIVTGCAAQINPETFNNMSEVDFVIGNNEKLSSTVWNGFKRSEKTNFKSPAIQVKDIMSVKSINPQQINKLAKRARAYVQIQNGCDHRCTFCIIPFGRGNSRSILEHKILNQIEKLVDNGFKEIVLTGVDLTSWGNDLPTKPKLGYLVRKILSTVPNLPRLRLSSIDSVEVDKELKDIILYEKRLMPHLHLSLQSGDNLILKRMKRRHSRQQAIDFCQEIQLGRPEITLGADIIVGFPTENESMFKNSIKLVHECNLTWLHIFPFSARQGTPAFKMPQVDRFDVKKRAHEIRTLGKVQVTKYLDSIVGKKQTVLIEGNGKGRTASFAEVVVDPNFKSGLIKTLVAPKHDGLRLLCV